MGGESISPAIRPINKAVIHRICSGQVILDLSSAVKELVENSLDAGATSIEINLKDYGEAQFKVIDNGSGISPSSFQALALKHHTSKISDFSDLHSLTTFGFRGEALSSLCALGKLTVETRTENELVGTRLEFNHSGVLKSETKAARQVGTTVTIENLFSTLPVRSKEFSRNIRREYGKLVSLLNAYAIIAKGVRLLCTNSSGKNPRSVVLKTQGSSSLKDNIITVFGLNTFQCLQPLIVDIGEGCSVEGFVSKQGQGSGRNLGDRQFFYVNGRPVDLPKVSKIINELYRSGNSKQYPIAIMNFCIPTATYDVNVTPDKRKIFFSSEGSVITSLREVLEKLYSPQQCSFSINCVENPEQAEKVLDESSDSDGIPARSKSSPTGAVGVDTVEENDDSPYFDHRLYSLESRGASDDGTSKESLLSEDANFSFDKSAESTGNKKDSDFKFDKFSRLSAYRLERPGSKLHLQTKNQYEKPSKGEQVSKSSPGLAQSSLTKFVTLSKRKMEDVSCPLSEFPVLRRGACSVGSRSETTETHDASKRLCTNVSSEDDSREGDESKLSPPHLIPETVENDCTHVHQQDIPVALEKIYADDGVDGLSFESCNKVPDMAGENHFGKSDIGSKESCSREPLFPQISYPPLQFSFDELRGRRRRNLSVLCRSKLPNQMKNRASRLFAAATLNTSQFECEKGKDHLLAAAVNELDRLFQKDDFRHMQVVGQFNLGFIIAKLDQDLFIVDQHAADEKYNFERLSQSTIMNVQPLLQPIRLELSPEEEVVASMHTETLRKNGFVLSEDEHAQPGRRFLLRAMPFSKNIVFGPEDVKDLISTLADSEGDCLIRCSYKMETADSICPPRVRAMLASRACRQSIMVGDPLTRNQMDKVLQNLADLRSPWNCPHGRPTMRHLADLTSIRSTR